MADFLIPYSDTAAAGQRLPASVRDEIRATGPTILVPVSGDTPAQTRARLNTALSTVSPFGQRRAVVLIGDFVVDQSVVVHSDTVLDLTNATVTMGTNANQSAVKNRAVSTVVRSFTATTTVGSTTVTATGSAFTSADVGRSIVVDTAGAGFSGNGGGFTSTIVSVTDATTVVVKAAPFKAVAGAAARLYDRDKNITIIGGTLDYGTQNGTVTDSLDLHLTRFRRVDGLRLHRVGFKSISGKYASSIADCTDVVVQDPFFDVSSDGIHLNGPIVNATVRGAKGKTGDDTVVVGCGDYITYMDVCGDVQNVTFHDVQSRCLFAPVKVFNGTVGHVMSGILVDGIYPEEVKNYCIDLGSADVGTIANIRNVTVRNVEAKPVNGGALVIMQGTGFGDVTLSNLRVRDGSNANLVSLSNTATVATLRMENVVARQNANNQILYAPTGCSVTTVVLDRCEVVGVSNTGGMLANLGGSFGYVLITNCRQTNGYNAILVNSATVMNLVVDKCYFDCNMAINHNGTVNHSIMIDNVTFNCIRDRDVRHRPVREAVQDQRPPRRPQRHSASPRPRRPIARHVRPVLEHRREPRRPERQPQFLAVLRGRVVRLRRHRMEERHHRRVLHPRMIDPRRSVNP